MFIPPILYERYPDIEQFPYYRVIELIDELNSTIKINYKVEHNKVKKVKTIKEVKNKRTYNTIFKKKAKTIREQHKVCQQCKSDYYLMVHHKDKDIMNNSDNNLILLCFHCHKKHHKHLIIPSFMKNRC